VSALLDDALLELLGRARRERPELAIDEAAFVAHARSGLAADATPADAAALHAGDLLLAFACSSGDDAAWRLLDREHLSGVGAFVARIDSSAAFADEVRQIVGERLLGPAGKLASYTGRGPLGGWMRVVAVREAQMLVRGRKPAKEIETFGGLEDSASGPESALFQRRSAELFRRAFSEVMAALEAEDKNLLRLYFADGRSYEELARVLQTSRASAARRVAEARARVLQRVERRIRDELGATAPGAETIYALVKSQLDVSVLRFLRGRE
jgi:RNA polymerase sigma-70 factor (ECF subfamily)